MSETLETALGSYRAELKAAEQAQHPIASADSSEIVVVTPKPTAIATAQERAQTNHQQRVEQQRTIKALQEQQWSTEAIAHKVRVSPRTVRRYRALPDFPEAPSQRPTFGRSLLDAYKQQIVAWWNSGIRQSNVMMELLKHKDYKGSQRTLQRYLSRLREAQGLPPVYGQVVKPLVKVVAPLPKVVDPQSPPFTPREAAYLITLKEENREAQHIELLDYLAKHHSDLALLIDLAHEFLQLVRQRQADAFDSWLIKTLTCQIKPLQKFAAGLMDDYAAVKASMMSVVSNGAVEGLNNRLKMLKRQIYGRAGLELLTKRFIMTA